MIREPEPEWGDGVLEARAEVRRRGINGKKLTFYGNPELTLSRPMPSCPKDNDKINKQSMNKEIDK